MQLKKTLYITLIILLTALTIHFVTIFMLPKYIGWRNINTQMNDYGVNLIEHIDINSERIRKINFSPDNLYSICAYDVSEKPLHFSALIPRSYWSIAFYSDNNQNFMTIDNNLGITSLELVLFGPETPPSNISNSVVATSPTSQGLIIVRIFVQRDDQLNELIKIRETMVCREYKN